MPGMPADQNQEAKGSLPGPEGQLATSGRRGQAILWKFIMPCILFSIGAGLLIWGAFLYPREPEESASPVITHLTVVSPDIPLSNIGYTVTQLPGDEIADLTISVTARNLPPPGAKAAAGVTVRPPDGTVLMSLHCSPACTRTQPWTVGLPLNLSKEATAIFTMRIKNFATASGSFVTSVALPRIEYLNKGQPLLLATYDFPSANAYDWSSYPPTSIHKSIVIWEEFLAERVTVGRIVDGINPAAQKEANSNTFFAGLLLGLGGGAVLSGSQEFLKQILRKSSAHEAMGQTGSTGADSGGLPSARHDGPRRNSADKPADQES